jgi:hypothetical protein
MSFEGYHTSAGAAVIMYSKWLMEERHDEWSAAMVRGIVHKDRTADFPKMASHKQALSTPSRLTS